MGRPRVLRFVGSPYILVAVTVAAATALAYYSYEYAREMAQRGEQSIVDTTKDVAQERVARIDNRILDSDSVLYNPDVVDVANLKDFRRRWAEISRLSPTIESVIVLDDK